jgi:hypothetical protein
VKKIARILLSILLIVCLFPASLLAAENNADETNAGSTTLSLSVYQVTVDCGSGGSFTVDGVTRTGSYNFYTNEGLNIAVNPNSGFVVDDTAVASGSVEMTVTGDNIAGENIALKNISSDVVLRISFWDLRPAASETEPDSEQETLEPEEAAADQAEDTVQETVTTDTTTTARRGTAANANVNAQADAADNAEDAEDAEETVLDQTITADITLAEVEGDAVMITSEMAESLTIEEDGTMVMVIPMTDRADQITKVSLSVDSLIALAEEKEGILRIQADGFEAEFDTTALRAIISQAQGNDIYLDVKQIETTELSDTQLSAVQDKVVLFSFSASIMSGDVNISQFYDGRASIKIPFEPEEGVDITEYAVVYIPTEGDLEVLESAYEDGCITFSTSHFSEYAIVRDASLTADTAAGAGYRLLILLLILLAALSLAGIIWIKKKEKRSENN